VIFRPIKMDYRLLLTLLIVTTSSVQGLLHSKKPVISNVTETRAKANVKIFSNLAEILITVGKLPVEFSAEDWSDIRSDSVTLVGANVSISRQTITEKKKSLDTTEVFIRSPVSTNNKNEFIKATMIDEKRNLVKIQDKDISKDPVYFYVSSNDIYYPENPPQSKYYVDFNYETSGETFLSYLRSNLNWKTRYQLNLFEETKTPVLIAMADIHNDGQSKVEIDHAELIAGDINLSAGGSHYAYAKTYAPQTTYMASSGMSFDSAASVPSSPKLSRGEELSGLYVHTINQPITIEGKTNYLLPMSRPRVTVDRYILISKTFYPGATGCSGKGQRGYRLISDQFLSQGNCIVRELDRVAGETSIPNLAAKDKHEFTIGEDVDVTYKENATLVSSRNATGGFDRHTNVARTVSVYEFQVSIRNFKRGRGVKVEYKQEVFGHSSKLFTPNTHFTQEGSAIKGAVTIGADEEKTFTYKVEVIH